MNAERSRPRWAEEKALALRAGAAKELVIWPIASTEQHGPHLPTGTDAMINEALQAGLISRSLAGCAVRLLPTLTIGASEHHIPFGGTLSLPPVQYARLLAQGMRCLLVQGHRRVLLLNSHGGNQAPMQTALAEIALEAADMRALVGGFSYWQVCEQGWRDLKPPPALSRIGHACGIETAIMLHLRPELVDMSQAKDKPFPASLEQPVSCALPFNVITQHGVIGYPSAATALWGRKFLQCTVRCVRAGIETWLRSVISIVPSGSSGGGRHR
jgi:creatinine amidohydrolase